MNSVLQALLGCVLSPVIIANVLDLTGVCLNAPQTKGWTSNDLTGQSKCVGRPRASPVQADIHIEEHVHRQSSRTQPRVEQGDIAGVIDNGHQGGRRWDQIDELFHFARCCHRPRDEDVIKPCLDQRLGFRDLCDTNTDCTGLDLKPGQ